MSCDLHFSARKQCHKLVHIYSVWLLVKKKPSIPKHLPKYKFLKVYFSSFLFFNQEYVIHNKAQARIKYLILDVFNKVCPILRNKDNMAWTQSWTLVQNSYCSCVLLFMYHHFSADGIVWHVCCPHFSILKMK